MVMIAPGIDLTNHEPSGKDRAARQAGRHTHASKA